MKTIIIVVLLGFAVLSFIITLGLVSKDTLNKGYDMLITVFVWLCSCILTVLAYNVL